MPLETEKKRTQTWMGQLAERGWVTGGELRQNPQEWEEKEQLLSPSLASADDQWFTAKSLSPKVDQYCSAQSGPCSITKPNEVAYIPLLPQGTLGGSTETYTHGPMPQKACSSLSLSFCLPLSLEKIPAFKIPAEATGEHKTTMLDRCLLSSLSSLSLHQCI